MGGKEEGGKLGNKPSCTHLSISGVKGLTEAGYDGVHHRHEDLLQEGEDALLVLGHQLVDERDELLDVVGLGERKEKENTTYTHRK